VIEQAQMLKRVMVKSDLAAEPMNSTKEVGAVYIANSFTVCCHVLASALPLSS
jgi:hypothetical protein